MEGWAEPGNEARLKQLMQCIVTIDVVIPLSVNAQQCSLTH